MQIGECLPWVKCAGEGDMLWWSNDLTLLSQFINDLPLFLLPYLSALAKNESVGGFYMTLGICCL